MKENIVIFLFIMLIFVLVIFGWSPVSHMLGKWNGYWEEKPEETASVLSQESRIYWENYHKANDDCAARTVKYFNTSTSSVSSYTREISSDYSTYDCYGIKYIKIK